MRVHKKKWAPDFLKETSFVFLDHADVTSFPFGTEFKSFYLEVGIGKGRYLEQIALANQDVLIVGIELNETIGAIAAKKISELNLTNVIIIIGDAKRVLPKLGNNKFSRIILNHSDPWPKKRHAKRRLTFPPLLAIYYEALVQGGELFFKTDNKDFALYTYETLRDSPFKMLQYNEDYDGSHQDDYMTEYELNFRNLGVPINFITAQKE